MQIKKQKRKRATSSSFGSARLRQYPSCSDSGCLHADVIRQLQANARSGSAIALTRRADKVRIFYTAHREFVSEELHPQQREDEEEQQQDER